MKLFKSSKIELDRTIKNTMSELPDGERGNRSTVSFMCQIAKEKCNHPLIRQTAIQIINKARTESHNHLDEAIAIGEYVQRHMKYMKDPVDQELLQDPVMIVEQMEKGVARGDCDDMSLVIATLLLSLGIRPYFKIVRWKKTSGNFNHIYIMVHEGNYKEKKQWFALDAIIKDKPMGYEIQSASSEKIPV